MKRVRLGLGFGLGLAMAACRGDLHQDAGADAPDVPSASDGVALGVFGVPSPLNGVEDPVFFVGCPRNGLASIELYYLEPDGSVVQQGTHVGTFTRTGTPTTHDHVAVGTSLVLDVDESGANPGDAPFVYPGTVTADPSFLNTVAHSFAVHVLNPAAPTFDNLGAWNMETLSTCSGS